MAYLRREAARMRKKSKKNNRARIVLCLPDLDHSKLRAEQSQLSQVATKPSIHDGTIHRLVLL
jgi:hypothetical protein